MYDLSNGVAQNMSRYILGVQIEGVWHTGVVVHDREYFFSRDTVYDTPEQTSFGKPNKVLSLGYTLWRQDELHSHIVAHLKPIFHREAYDAIEFNCNHFSAALCEYLVGASLPEEVVRQPEYLQYNPIVKLGKPWLTWYLKDGIVQRREKDHCRNVKSRLGQDKTDVPDQKSTLMPGTFVQVESIEHDGPVTWGIMLGNEGRPDGLVVNNSIGKHGEAGIFSCGACRCSDSAIGAPDNDSLSVRFFEFCPADPQTRSAGNLRTEIVPRRRIFASRLPGLSTESIYKLALQTIEKVDANSVPISARSRIEGSTKTKAERRFLSETDEDPKDNMIAQERAMEELIQIGFEASQAETALDTSNWGIDAAMALLNEKKTSGDGSLLQGVYSA
jgi:hypothetical protein